MAITYPINTPDSIGIGTIKITPLNSVATTKSPFSMTTQTFSWSGQQWVAEVSIPTVKRDLAAPWKAFLTALKGQTGTFLLGDPDYATPIGTATTMSVSGNNRGDVVVIDSIDGTLKAGDYFQLGAGASARLHTVLEDVDGTGTYNIWPNLKDDYSSETAILDSPKGVFRLTENGVPWDIASNSFYSIQFNCEEVL